MAPGGLLGTPKKVTSSTEVQDPHSQVPFTYYGMEGGKGRNFGKKIFFEKFFKQIFYRSMEV